MQVRLTRKSVEEGKAKMLLYHGLAEVVIHWQSCQRKKWEKEREGENLVQEKVQEEVRGRPGSGSVFRARTTMAKGE
jgi:hypothetical protein